MAKKKTKTKAQQKAKKEIGDWGEIRTKKRANELWDIADEGIIKSKPGTFDREYYEVMEGDVKDFFVDLLRKAKNFFMILSAILLTVIIVGVLVYFF